MNIIKENAIKAAKFLDEKKGYNVSLIEVAGVVPYTDYMIFTTGISNKHVGALSNYLRKELSKNGIKIRHFEGNNESGWILLDFIDFVVHIFSEEKREFYNLDRIWNDAKKIDIDILNENL
ncbi:ribosome silencing factor [Clostridiaceae bacterium HSG29]|nr:ribosome silencing factor [Clostridiaceae bacterium HSG29]